MIISCPSCSAKYLVSTEDIGSGRQVKCTRCNYSWFYENTNYENDKKLEIEQISKSNIQRDHAKGQNLPVVYEKRKNIPLPFLVLLIPVIFIAIEMIIRNSNINALEFSKELNNLIETIVNIIGSLFSS